jgi:hypothetical protein
MQISKILDVGPRKTMKRKMDLARQVIGTLRYSGSTLSLLDHGHVNISDRGDHVGDSPWDGSLREVIEQVLEEELEGTHRLVGQPSRGNFRS